MEGNPQFSENSPELVEKLKYEFTFVDMSDNRKPEIFKCQADSVDEANILFAKNCPDYDIEDIGRIQIAN